MCVKVSIIWGVINILKNFKFRKQLLEKIEKLETIPTIQTTHIRNNNFTVFIMIIYLKIV